MKLVRTFMLATVMSVPVVGHVFAEMPVTARADIIGIDGKTIGEARLTQGATGVLIHLKVAGLPPGAKGLHLHSHGTCEPHTGFKSAKGHVGLVKGGHGLLNPRGPEAGDLPNIFIAADGKGEMEAYTTLVSLTAGEHNLLDSDGSTFVIHAAPDDHKSQPIGGAGGRIACGIIKAGS